jgi:hypothetical protein
MPIVIQLTVRLPPRLAEWLKDRARDEDRTVNAVLTRIVRDAAASTPTQKRKEFA